MAKKISKISNRRTVQETTISQFMQSFRDIVQLKTVYLVLFELLLFLLLFIGLAGYSAVMLKLAANVSSQGIDKLEKLLANPDQAAQIHFDPSVLTTFMVMVVLVSFLLLLFLIAATALSRCLIWAKLTEQPFTGQLYKRFFLLHLIWIPIILIVGMGGGLLLNKLFPFATHPNVLILGILIAIGLIAYFAQFLYFSFSTRQEKFFAQFGRAIGRGFSHVTRYIAPYLLIIAVFFVLGFLNLSFFKSLPENAARWLQMIMLLLFVTWYRYCVLRMMK